MKKYLIIACIFVFILATASVADSYPKSNSRFNSSGEDTLDSSFGIIAGVELSGVSAGLMDSQITHYKDSTYDDETARKARRPRRR